MTEGHGVPVEIVGRWSDLIADTEATAEELAAAGYDTIAVHAGDVTPLPDEQTLDVLVPDDEFEQIGRLAAGVTVDEFAVYAATEGRVTFAVVAAEAPDAGVAICVPVFVTERTVGTLGEQARDAGTLFIRLRPLSEDDSVELALSDPDLLFGAVGADG